MIDEPNFRNHHHQQKEPEAEVPLLPELETLAAQMTADGVAWQSRLPDTTWLAERIRAIPDAFPLTSSQGVLPIVIHTSGALKRGRLALPQHERATSLLHRLGGLVAVVVVLALVGSMAFAFYAVRHSNGDSAASTRPPSTSAEGSGPLTVTSVLMSVNPATITGIPCGTNMTVTYTALFRVTPTSHGGIVQFSYTINNGRGEHPASITFGSGESTKAYAFSWTGALPADHVYPGLGGVQVTSPNPLSSALVVPTGQCTPPAAPPACGSNFSGPYQGTLTTTFGDVPLPPLSRIVPNNASGGVRGYDICSAGTASTVSGFMRQNLPSYGWTLLSGSGNQETWKNSSGTINWDVTDPLDWNVNWRVPLA